MMTRCLTAVFVCAAVAGTAFGQSGPKPAPAGVTPAAGAIGEYRSQHFFMHTDLTPAESKELLERLETMLGLISQYWGRPSRGIIEMYVIKDLDNWPAGSLEPSGRAKVAAGGGVTQTVTLGYGQGKNREITDAKAVVFAGADHGTPQHEAVHAYCGQTFGRTGPVWYSEGMAELGNYWRKGDKTVNVHPAVVEHIRSSEIKTLNAIVNNREATGDSWQNYAWRWALCHMLENNPNYSARFRPFGLDLLNDKPTTFEQVYGDMANEMSFEYTFFLQHLENGYRVDLCSWDWKKKFAPLKGAQGITARVQADRGWQPTSATVAQGQRYEYSTTGTWKIDPTGSMLTADGDSQGHGKLVGVVMKDFKLGEEFPLGSNGEFTAPGDGNLYLRCSDGWVKLADNKGVITVKLKPKQ
jgi:hypothetical protein